MKLDKLVQIYMRFRKQKEELTKLYEENLHPLEEKMSKINNEILKFLNETGQESAKTAYGTPYKRLTKSIRVIAPDEFFNFVKEHDAFDLLQARVTKSAYEQLEEEGIEVPGLHVESKLSVVIKKN